MSQRNIIIGLVITLGVIGAGLLLKDNTFDIRVSEDRLEQSLSKKLPLQKTYLAVFDITLTNPSVDLKQGSDRVLAGLDVSLDIGAFGKSLTYTGTIEASGGVRYVPEEGAFYLADPVIEQLAIDGLPENYREKVRSVSTSALQEFYDTRPVYRLEDRNMKESVTEFALKGVRVDGDTLVVTLGY